MDRHRLGSKHHLIVYAQGVSLAVILTGGNRNDVTQFNALVQAIHIPCPSRKSLRVGPQIRATSAALARTCPFPLSQLSGDFFDP